MNPEDVVKEFIGNYGWAFIAGIFALAFKDAISKTWNGFLFMVGSDFDVDDVVYIKGNKKARIVRQSIFKTTFYLYDSHRKLIVPNDRLWTMDIEKFLPDDENLTNS